MFYLVSYIGKDGNEVIVGLYTSQVKAYEAIRKVYIEEEKRTPPKFKGSLPNVYDEQSFIIRIDRLEADDYYL